MTKIDKLLNNEEILRLEDYVKKKNSNGITKLAWKKYKEGHVINRIHSTRSHVNVHESKISSPV